MLGGNHQQILASYIFPRAIPYIIYGSIGLGCIYSLQGLCVPTSQWKKVTVDLPPDSSAKFSMIQGYGSAVYLVLLCLAIVGSLFITKYTSVEFKLAKAMDNTGYTKKGRRRRTPKKKRKKKQKEEKQDKKYSKVQ